MDEEAAVELMWIRPDARKEREATGKAGENGTEPLGGKTQPYQKTILQRYTKEGNEARDGNEPRERVWGTRAEEAGRKEGRRNSRETHREQEQGDLWRTGTDRGTKW